MWQKDSNSVNYRHMALLVDAMTSRGFLTSVNRHGINKGDIGPLAKCSFEQTTDMLINAGVFAEVDHINGVAANIMLGQVAPCGTGDSEILLDEKILHSKGYLAPVPSIQGKTKVIDDEIVDKEAALVELPTYKLHEVQPAARKAKIEADELEIV
jgi:hypothetical protein